MKKSEIVKFKREVPRKSDTPPPVSDSMSEMIENGEKWDCKISNMRYRKNQTAKKVLS